MATLQPGQTTLAQIRLQARQRADRVMAGAPLNAYPDPYANSYITTDELNGYINRSYGELQELLIVDYGSYWSTTSTQIITDGMNEQFALPQDMFKLLSAEAVMTPGTNTNNVTLRRFNLQERNAINYVVFTPAPYSGAIVPEYALFGNNIWFKPLPSGGLTIQLLYVPRPPSLVDSGAITMNSCVAGQTVTINSLVFTAVAFGQPQTSTNFVVGGTTATNLGDVGTAASLASILNASSLGGRAGILQATADDINVALVLTAPAIIVWSSSGSEILLTPNAVSGPTGSVIQWTNVMTGYAGLEEFLIIDAAIKMMQKEESDVSVLFGQKSALVARIQRNYVNRDAGSPKTVTNVHRNGGWYGWGGGNGGGRLGW